MLNCLKDEFSLPANITYLNCASRSPLSKAVELAALRGISRELHPHLIKEQDFFEEPGQLRKAYARLINCREPERIVIIPSVSYGMATVAKNVNINSGGKIILVGEEFPSNVYVWHRLCGERGASVQHIPAPESFESRGQRWNERILEAIDSRTRLVAISHVHWTDGTLFNLAAIRQRTREVGALLVVDGTQSVGALPFDIQQFQPDALICAGYKWLMGPYSVGLAYYNEHFDEGTPLEENWINRHASEDFSRLVDYQSAYRPKALRYEMGERSNFILLPMLLTAIEQLNERGVIAIQDYCRHLTVEPIKKLRKIGCLIEEDALRGGHLFGIALPKGISLEKLKSSLSRNEIFVSFRGQSVRISPNVYNDSKDMSTLVDCMQEVIEG